MLLCDACHKRLIHGGHVQIEAEGQRLAFLLADGTAAPVRDPAGLRDVRPLSANAEKVLAELGAEPISIDDVIERSGLPVERALGAITELEIARLAQCSGAWVSRAAGTATGRRPRGSSLSS